MRLTRTTVELTEEQRVSLLHLAAARGLKGFSILVQDAVNQYLDQEKKRENHVKAALDLKGALSEKEAKNFEIMAKSLRENWR